MDPKKLAILPFAVAAIANAQVDSVKVEEVVSGLSTRFNVEDVDTVKNGVSGYLNDNEVVVTDSAYIITPKAGTKMTFDKAVLLIGGTQAKADSLDSIPGLKGIYAKDMFENNTLTAKTIEDSINYILTGDRISVEEPVKNQMSNGLTIMPNPANPIARLVYNNSVAGQVDATIINLANGRLVRNLYSGKEGKGLQTKVWDGRDKYGKKVASGTYLATVKTNKGRMQKKVIITK